MKRNLRKVLSLVLVVIMLCGAMMPAALAAGTGTGNNDLSVLVCLFTGRHTYVPNGLGGFVCQYCGTSSTTGNIGGVGGFGGMYGHSHQYTYINESYHYVHCTDTTCYYNVTTSNAYELHSGTPCVYCSNGTASGNIQWTVPTCVIGSVAHTPKFNYAANGYNYYYCTVTGCEAMGYAPVGTTGNTTQQWSNGSIYCTGTSTLHHAVRDSHYDYRCEYCNATSVSYSGGLNTTLNWTNGSFFCTGTSTAHDPVAYQTTGGYIGYYCNNPGCTATATSYAGNPGYNPGLNYGSQYAVGSNGILTVYGYDTLTNNTYTLNETVSLYATASVKTGTLEDYTVTYNWIGATPSYFDSATAYLDTSRDTSTAYCTVTITSKTDSTITDTATIRWIASAAATSSIAYSALKGQTVKLNQADFEKLWAKQYPFGTLEYVRFTNVSTGNLYDNYSSAQRVDVRAYGSSCYSKPTAASQIGLDDLTYVPAAYGNASTVTIQFTAFGSANSGYYGSSTLNGTITIMYTAKEVTPITYSVAGANVKLDADDFIAKYKEVMGVNYVADLSVQFLEVPTNGTLYLNYNNSSFYQNTGTALTAANIDDYTFSAVTSYSTDIEDLTYIPGKAEDTIKFACYSNGQMMFIGTVTFGQAKQYTVEMTTTTGKAVALDLNAFKNADESGILVSGNIYFGTPTKGTLYKSYANGTGTKVTAADGFTGASLNTVTYVPASGYVGAVEIPYTAYTYLGGQINGTLKIFVGRNFTDVLGTDSAWAAPYINKLSAQGIVNGTGTGTTYSPTKTVTYGEALKLIMMAAGYSEQAKTSTHWASGYLTKAYKDGLVSSVAIDLNAEVNRDTIAELTAKALKLGYASTVKTGIKRPSDSTNGYVYALYNAGIINGVNVGATNYWYGTRSITRAEISKIICMVADYEK